MFHSSIWNQSMDLQYPTEIRFRIVIWFSSHPVAIFLYNGDSSGKCQCV